MKGETGNESEKREEDRDLKRKRVKERAKEKVQKRERERAMETESCLVYFWFLLFYKPLSLCVCVCVCGWLVVLGSGGNNVIGSQNKTMDTQHVTLKHKVIQHATRYKDRLEGHLLRQLSYLKCLQA